MTNMKMEDLGLWKRLQVDNPDGVAAFRAALATATIVVHVIAEDKLKSAK